MENYSGQWLPSNGATHTGQRNFQENYWISANKLFLLSGHVSGRKKTCSKFSDQAIFRLHRVILKIAWVNNLKALKTQSAWHKATLLVHFGSGDCYAGRHMPFHDYQSYQTLGYTDYVQKMNLLNCWEYFGSQFSKWKFQIGIALSFS